MHKLMPTLLAARASLAECREEDLDLELPLLLVEQSICNIEYCMKKLVERKEIFNCTEALIKFLQDAEVDYTLLMYLQVSDSVTKGKGFISYLKGICEQHKVPYTNQFFFDAVWAHFTKAGVRPITPTKYIMHRKKDEILQQYKTIRSRNDWAQHNPFFFQTFITVKGKGFQKLVFFITRTWQDGVIRMHEILEKGGFVNGTTMYDAHGVFEHCIDDESLASLILDSEILASAFGDAANPAEIARELRQFPSIVGTEMVAKGLLNEEDMLHVVVKDKIRPRGDTTKVSFHFVLCVCAHKGQQKQCIELFLSDYKDSITAGLTHLQTHGRLPEGKPLPTAWYAFDAKAAISNGFTTAFSLKDKSDPHSRKHSDTVVCAGMQIRETLCPMQEQDFAHLAEAERLWLLQDQLYTIPKRHMLSYAMQLHSEDKVCLYQFISNFPAAIGIRTRNTPFGGSKKRGRPQAPNGLISRSVIIRRRRSRASTCQHGSRQRSGPFAVGRWGVTAPLPLSSASAQPSPRSRSLMSVSTRSLPCAVPVA